MRKIKYIVLFLAAFFTQVHAQQVIETRHSRWDFVTETAIGAGLGVGGNSVFGVEIQTMFLPRLSAQLGAGVGGFSAGLNYHIYPTVRSPYFSAQIWQNGFGNNYKAIYAGPMFVYRADRLLQVGLGAGYQIDKNPAVDFNSKYILMFNLGVYLPM